MTKAALINWYGPYTFEEMKEEKEWGDGIYLVTGKLKYKKKADIHYCGITERNFYGRFKRNSKLEKIERDKEFWVGEIDYPNQHKRDILELIENLIIYYWQPELNEKKKRKVPEEVTIINKWFTQNEEVRYEQAPIVEYLTDVISWDGETWRAGNLEVWNN